MICPHCKIDCNMYRQINQSGSKVVVERCPKCRRNPNNGKPFYSKKGYDWDSLPLFEDYTINSPKCEVKGCTNTGVEYHHFSPRHLFENCDDWPTGWLCKPHHIEWHKKTRTGMFDERRMK